MKTHPAVSMPKQSDFLAIPESPVVYWLRPRFFELLMGILIGDSANVCQGMATADDGRFVRHNWETSDKTTWFSYEKGGGYKKWFGNQFWMVNWAHEGANIKASPTSVVRNEHYYFGVGWTYSYVARGSLGLRLMEGAGLFAHVSSAIFVDKEGAAAVLNTRVSSFIVRSISARIQLTESYVTRIPFLPSVDAILIKMEQSCLALKRQLVATDPTERSFDAIITDSSPLDAIAAVLHTLEGFNEREVFTAYGVAGADMQAVLDETGVPAGFHPLITGYDALPELPSDLDLPPLPQEVLDYLAVHQRIVMPHAEFQRIKARLRAMYEAGPGVKESEEATEAAEGSKGDEDVAVSGAHIPIPTETFLEELSVKLEIHPISVYWLLEELRAEGARCKPEELRLLEDRLSVLIFRLLGHEWPTDNGSIARPFMAVNKGVARPIDNVARPFMAVIPDEDGIIPLTSGVGQPTLAERLRIRLREEDGATGAQQAEALLAELTGLSLEEWLRRTFFKRHMRQFKYRPIAWHFASNPSISSGGKGRGKGSGRALPAFECFVYYHACSGDVLARIRTQYVEPLLRAERQCLTAASQASQETEQAQAQGRIQELEEFNRRLQQVADVGFASPELEKFVADEPLDRWSGDGLIAPSSHADFLRQEQGWRVDLNDGVRVNIAPIQLAGLLAMEVFKAADARKAIADRARWRADERRWVRQGKLPRCGWMPDDILESPKWTELAPQREAERAKLAEKRRAVIEQRVDSDVVHDL